MGNQLENRMEKNMEKEMETGFIQVLREGLCK